MAQHRPPRPLRLFIAALPTLEWRERASALVSQLALPAHKVTPLEQMHLTVLFVGERRPSLLEAIVESVRASVKGLGPIVLSPRHLTAIPEAGPARLIAVEMDAPSPLLELHKRLVARLVKLERRPGVFVPHLTLLRFGGAGIARTQLPAPPEPAAVDALGQIAIDELLVMSSVLHPLGAKHQVEAQVALDA